MNFAFDFNSPFWFNNDGPRNLCSLLRRLKENQTEKWQRDIWQWREENEKFLLNRSKPQQYGAKAVTLE